MGREVPGHREPAARRRPITSGRVGRTAPGLSQGAGWGPPTPVISLEGIRKAGAALAVVVPAALRPPSTHAPRASVFALLAACGEVALPPAADARVGRGGRGRQAGGEGPVVLTLRTRLAEGWTRARSGVEGLEVDAGPSAPRQVGAYTVAEQQLELTGPNGSYVIDVAPVVATGPGGETLELDPEPIFVDVGVQGPASTLSEFEAAPPPAETPWAWIAAAVAALLLLGGLGAWRWSRRGEVPWVPPRRWSRRARTGPPRGPPGRPDPSTTTRSRCACLRSFAPGWRPPWASPRRRGPPGRSSPTSSTTASWSRMTAPAPAGCWTPRTA